MTNKIYVKVKSFLKENYFYLIVIAVTIFLGTFKLPFYVDAPGGLIDTNDRIKIKGSYKSEGTFYMTYVSEIKTTIPIYLYALINKDWDIVDEKEMTYGDLSVNEVIEYGKITMKESNKDAIKIAYEKAGYEVEEKNSNTVLIYRSEKSDTDLKVGDIIDKIEDEKVTDYDDIIDKLSNYKVGDKINFDVTNNGKKYKRYAKLISVDGEAKIGIILLETRDIITNPSCVLSYNNNESGSSGGLMTTLTIYNSLIEKDLTHGLKIAGTGTIERDGKVGEIAGVKYKLIGAVKNKAKIFFVPDGENYKEAVKVKKEKGYDIEIVSVKTFDDAVLYLENYK